MKVVLHSICHFPRKNEITRFPTKDNNYTRRRGKFRSRLPDAKRLGTGNDRTGVSLRCLGVHGLLGSILNSAGPEVELYL